MWSLRQDHLRDRGDDAYAQPARADRSPPDDGPVRSVSPMARSYDGRLRPDQDYAFASSSAGAASAAAGSSATAGSSAAAGSSAGAGSSALVFAAGSSAEADTGSCAG